MNIGFIITFIISVILASIDLILTYRHNNLLQYIELNPAYHFFGSLFPIVIINVLFFIFVYYWYHNKNTGSIGRYVVLLCLMIIILFRLLAVNNAISWEDNTLTTEEIKEIYTPEAMKQAQKTYIASMYASIIFCLVTFLVWKIDHTSERKDKKKKKNR